MLEIVSSLHIISRFTNAYYKIITSVFDYIYFL